MYDNQTPHQKANLIYGGRLRYARALVAQAQSAEKMYPGMFTQSEINQIAEISENAAQRAKEVYDNTIQELSSNSTNTKAGSGPSPVSSERVGQQPEG